MNKTIILFILIPIFLLTSCDARPVFYNDSVNKELLSNSWVPEFIHEGYNINILFAYDIDTNEVWGKYTRTNNTDNLSNSQIDNQFTIPKKNINRLYKIGMTKQYSTVTKIQYQNSSWFLFSKSEDEIIYFWGKYK